MFQCFETKLMWPGIFTFSLTLFQSVSKRFKFGLIQFVQLIYYIIYMCQCFEVSKHLKVGTVSTCFNSVSKHVQVRTY